MKVRLRKIYYGDVEMLFNWRNHPAIRQNSFDTSKLSMAGHKEWFVNVLNNDDIITYILEIGEIPVGVIRFDVEGQILAKINYFIDPSQQGKGYGSKILALGVKRVFKENSALKKVYGLVLKDNLASIKIFKKLSFDKVWENTSELKFEKSIE
ncbi:GNAT family N-acetyltransferase [Zunongwangia sp. F260]|uniref:GNAT family N-acetyltransferase n=1 Tax=Autumnicola lenta TaxID=3075593 RepID=A0ABU3CI60_9FLAO|nr:GNAT family N-acetyltransferase [Zunongwangia sp. F260]MDT0645912.1 GNAT family N-acetyltransferase [Zunongwangia sp. F260]